MENKLETMFKQNFLNEKFSYAAFSINFMLYTGRESNTFYIQSKDIKDLILKVILSNIKIPYIYQVRLRKTPIIKYVYDKDLNGKYAIDNLVSLLKSNIYYTFEKKDVIEILSWLNVKTFDVKTSNISPDLIEIDDDGIAFISQSPDKKRKYFSIESLEIDGKATLANSLDLELYKSIRPILNALKLKS